MTKPFSIIVAGTTVIKSVEQLDKFTWKIVGINGEVNAVLYLSANEDSTIDFNNLLKVNHEVLFKGTVKDDKVLIEDLSIRSLHIDVE